MVVTPTSVISSAAFLMTGLSAVVWTLCSESEMSSIDPVLKAGV